MSINIVSYTELDPSQVEENTNLLVELNQARNPNIDYRNGVLREILLDTSAAIRTAMQVEQTRLLQASSIQSIGSNPTLADTDTVDRVLSNYLISRQPGSNATGLVAVVLSSPLEVNIPAGFVFRYNNLSFLTTRATAAQRRVENVRSDNDSLLIQINGGAWLFYVPVQAENTGAEYGLRANVTLVPASNITGFLKAYAANNFTGGVKAQSTADLVNAVQQQGLVCRALSGRVNMNAFLFERYPRASSSIVGYGDAEMLRDRRSIFPVSIGKRIDWWIRFNSFPETITQVKQATLISVTDFVGTWQFTTDVNDAPGYYQIESIRKEQEDAQFVSFPVVEETFNYALPSESNEGDNETFTYVPDIRSAFEARFTRYQTSIVQFEDNRTNHVGLVPGATQNYLVTYLYFPQLASLQDEINTGTIRPNCDILVKAAVPVFVSVEVIIGRPTPSITVDSTAVQLSVLQVVNEATGIADRIYVSSISNSIYAVLPVNCVVKRINLRGEGFAPDGTRFTHASSECLKIERDAARLLTTNTVTMFTDMQSINVVIESL